MNLFRLNQLINENQIKLDAIAAAYTETPNEGLAALHEAIIQRIERLMKLLADAEQARRMME
jgi:hypothetical protein